MHGIRLTILLMIFAGAMVVSVGLRVEQRRCLIQIQQLRLKDLQMRQTLNHQQLEIARLRSPGLLQRRLDLQDLCVVAPWEAEHRALSPVNRVVASSNK